MPTPPDVPRCDDELLWRYIRHETDPRETHLVNQLLLQDHTLRMRYYDLQDEHRRSYPSPAPQS